MTTEQIRGYYKVDDQVITGGQPTEGQLRSAAEDGVQVVINLATFDPNSSLSDEGGLVRSLGLEYYPIPVAWDRPTEADFVKFANVLSEIGSKKVLIHCAANYRVTAFYSLYAMQHLGWSEAQADALRAVIWRKPYPIWEDFIRQMKQAIGHDEGTHEQLP